MKRKNENMNNYLIIQKRIRIARNKRGYETRKNKRGRKTKRRKNKPKWPVDPREKSACRQTGS
jgi:hypothetical protein